MFLPRTGRAATSKTPSRPASAPNRAPLAGATCESLLTARLASTRSCRLGASMQGLIPRT
eukprot:5383552-Alexandrium_andersonii.AAC.1